MLGGCRVRPRIHSGAISSGNPLKWVGVAQALACEAVALCATLVYRSPSERTPGRSLAEACGVHSIGFNRFPFGVAGDFNHRRRRELQATLAAGRWNERWLAVASAPE